MKLSTPEGVEAVFNGKGFPSKDGLVVTKEAVKGLWSAPASKTTTEERQTGNGAHDVSNGRVLYSARTVTIPFGVATRSHEAVQKARNLINTMMGQSDVTLTVNDGSDEFFLQGFITPTYSDVWNEATDTGSITMVCVNPEKQSTFEQYMTLLPVSGSSGGLRYGEDGIGLEYPLSYGKQETDARNHGTLANSGTTRAFPIITVYGTFESVRLDWRDSTGLNQTLTYESHVGRVPLVIDTYSMSAHIGGTDVSQNLGRRGFPTIPKGGDISVTLMSTGTGWVTISSRDTSL